MANDSQHPDRSSYRHFEPVQTRWQDNDIYGHVNNAVYYSYFDMAVNRYLITNGVIDIENGPLIGLVVSTACTYFASVSFPMALDAGIKVEHLGNSSVRYGVALFEDGDHEARASGHFVHVYVDRITRRPQHLPSYARARLGALCAG